MIPGFTLCPNNLRQVAMISECEGSYIIEPMRFLYPSEAKKESTAKHPKVCPHNNRRDWLKREIAE
jgi:hypothetical protein